jgi:SOS-response transcriptional repressor LexA
VANVGGEVALRRLHCHNDRTVLVPDHPDFQRGPAGDEQFRIEGIVVGSLRHRGTT